MELSPTSSQTQTTNHFGDNHSSVGDFKPYVPAGKEMKELSLRAVLLGLFFAILFGMSSVYLALRAGLTVGGSIPIAVIVIGLFKRYGKSTILENNMVQTIGSAGESIASGITFTTIALLFLSGGDRYFQYTQLMTLAIVGGLLGILFMIPLRRSLIVKEHKTLRYPEGTACAEVLIAGEKEGDFAKPVFIGAAVSAFYWLSMKLFGMWKEIADVVRTGTTSIYPNATLTVNVTPEYLGIGYIIGPRVTSQMLMGGLFAWLVLIPCFTLFPQLATWLGAKDVFTTLSNLGLHDLVKKGGPATAAHIHAAYVKYIAVGAVVGAGVITLIKTLPIILGGLRSVVDALRADKQQQVLRTEKDVPMSIVVIGSVVMVLLIAILPNLPGKFPGSLILSGLIVIFGFFFVTVSSRFVGVAGYSIEPVTPMMFTTVMATCLIFIVLGWTSDSYQAIVVLIGAVVCIAAGNAGATSQDLKTGFLLGATPRKQQIGLFLGVVLSALVVGVMVLLVDRSMPGIPHAIGYIEPGQDAAKFGAPQASILAMLIKAVLENKMAWGLVLIGAGLALVIELTGLMALSVAAGIYLPLATTTAIFCGSLVRLIINLTRKRAHKGSAGHEGELSRGMLYSTGLVAGGAISGMGIGFFNGFLPNPSKLLDVGHEYWEKFPLFGDILPLYMFVILAFVLYLIARKDE